MITEQLPFNLLSLIIYTLIFIAAWRLWIIAAIKQSSTAKRSKYSSKYLWWVFTGVLLWIPITALVIWIKVWKTFSSILFPKLYNFKKDLFTAIWISLFLLLGLITSYLILQKNPQIIERVILYPLHIIAGAIIFSTFYVVSWIVDSYVHKISELHVFIVIVPLLLYYLSIFTERKTAIFLIGILVAIITWLLHKQSYTKTAKILLYVWYLCLSIRLFVAMNSFILQELTRAPLSEISLQWIIAMIWYGLFIVSISIKACILLKLLRFDKNEKEHYSSYSYSAARTRKSIIRNFHNRQITQHDIFIISVASFITFLRTTYWSISINMWIIAYFVWLELYTLYSSIHRNNDSTT